jgi:RNA-binding protein NOB1
MQIGLNVVTVDGRIIRELRSYILRCYACFATTPNMKKIFCPKCGNKTLKRVSVYIDKEGNKRMFINFKKPISTRGKRVSIKEKSNGIDRVWLCNNAALRCR